MCLISKLRLNLDTVPILIQVRLNNIFSRYDFIFLIFLYSELKQFLRMLLLSSFLLAEMLLSPLILFVAELACLKLTVHLACLLTVLQLLLLWFEVLAAVILVNNILFIGIVLFFSLGCEFILHRLLKCFLFLFFRCLFSWFFWFAFFRALSFVKFGWIISGLLCIITTVFISLFKYELDPLEFIQVVQWVFYILVNFWVILDIIIRLLWRHIDINFFDNLDWGSLLNLIVLSWFHIALMLRNIYRLDRGANLTVWISWLVIMYWFV